ncbi:50S ribosomal protein L11 methyltransferase [Magnetospirillum moscoviense]|uniref:Ribosomal protein L11 methyltransferase n=1 Tax=Magnetospirillum moscoviense TaxID=1437059 RepID=A0A178MSS2_9PROT|nr:50S ribosomal protein L11 methyltransferase [Magnetospirillum moscoviense]OAN52440.1 50S ribosomal protein L11 methyltransferase [Magnetospirillum moscoviense]
MRSAFPAIWHLRLKVGPDALPLFEEVFETFAESVTMFMEDKSGISDGDCDWFLEGYSRTPPERVKIVSALSAVAAAHGIDVPALDIEQLDNIDWVLENLRDFPPIDAGRFFVRGSHWHGRVPVGRTELLVDAGTAFGSGEHATTKGCLMMLDRLAKRRRFMKPLDLGSGSGILGIAMAKMWAVDVLATDIDPAAVKVAAINARLNGVASRFTSVLSDGYRNRALKKGRPFDIIVANILAKPLMRMAKDLAAHLAPDGVAVLSGLLDWQERMVMGTHERQGLRLKDRVVRDGWATLLIGR